MQKYPMTVEGAEALRNELDELKIQRIKIADAISTARALGDLKENAEYHAAREQQGLNEARIRDIEAKLSNAQIIDVQAIENTGRVIFGATVTLYHLNDEIEVTYQIVGEDEADIKRQKISCTSPLARALIGKNEGDEIQAHTPAGVVDYEILKVAYE